MSKAYYVASCVIKSHDVELNEMQLPLKLSWADGMVGVMPVFTNKKKAKKYAPASAEILTFKQEE
jgi:hypothetical protein